MLAHGVSNLFPFFSLGRTFLRTIHTKPSDQNKKKIYCTHSQYINIIFFGLFSLYYSFIHFFWSVVSCWCSCWVHVEHHDMMSVLHHNCMEADTQIEMKWNCKHRTHALTNTISERVELENAKTRVLFIETYTWCQIRTEKKKKYSAHVIHSHHSNLSYRFYLCVCLLRARSLDLNWIECIVRRTPVSSVFWQMEFSSVLHIL